MTTPKYGARTYDLENGVVLVKQTVLRNGRYVVVTDDAGNHRERHADPGPNQGDLVGQAVLDAHRGIL
jgi:hypothetical protein